MINKIIIIIITVNKIIDIIIIITMVLMLSIFPYEQSTSINIMYVLLYPNDGRLNVFHSTGDG